MPVYTLSFLSPLPALLSGISSLLLQTLNSGFLMVSPCMAVREKDLPWVNAGNSLPS